MIHSLKIKNFESHQDSYFQFHPGVNVIIGKTDAGKSSIIRALKWLIEYRPTGNNFQSYWGGDTEVEIETNNGDFKLIKSSNQAIYQEGENVYKAFGVKVPEEITKKMNIGSINLQRQMESHFLLSSSAGEVASHFNEIANLEMIDQVNAKVKSDLNTIERWIEYKEKDIKETREKLKKYEKVPRWDELLIKYEATEVKIQSRRDSLERLYGMIESWVDFEQEIQHHTRITQYQVQYDAAQEVYQDLIQRRENYDRIQKDIESLVEKENELDWTRKFIELSPGINQSLEKQAELMEIKQKLHNFNSILTKYIQLEESIKIVRQNAFKLNSEYQEKFPDVCPLCGTDLSTGNLSINPHKH